MTTAPAVAWMLHVLAAHLGVPEPVRFTVGGPVPGFEVEARHDAVMDWDGASWVIRYAPGPFRRADQARARLVIAHELCHAVYNHTPGAWNALDEKQQRAEHKRVKACAANVIRHHRERVNHAPNR